MIMITENKGEQQSCLTPYETRISVDALIFDGSYVFRSNSDGYHSLEFVPFTSYDHQRLAELIENCKTLVYQRSGYYSQKNIRTCVERKNGIYVATQIFRPVVDPIPPYEVFDDCQHASLELYLNDDPSGEIYLNCSYINLYSPNNGIDEDYVSEREPDIDF